MTVDAGGYIEGQKLPTEPTYVKSILIANKKNPLPSTFAPGEDKAARAAFEQMAAEATLRVLILQLLVRIERSTTKRRFMKDMSPVMARKQPIPTVHVRAIPNTKRGLHLILVK